MHKARRSTSLGSRRARSQKRETASGSASGGTGYSTSPCTRRSSRLVTRSVRLGQAPRSDESSGAASITCSTLSSEKEQLALGNVLGETVLRAEGLRDRLGD